MSLVVLGTWGSAPSGLGSGAAATPENPWRGGDGAEHTRCVWGQLAETPPTHTLLPPSPSPRGAFSAQLGVGAAGSDALHPLLFPPLAETDGVTSMLRPTCLMCWKSKRVRAAWFITVVPRPAPPQGSGPLSSKPAPSRMGMTCPQHGPRGWQGRWALQMVVSRPPSFRS